MTRRQRIKRLRREQARDRKFSRFVDRLYERLWDMSFFRKLLMP